MEKKQFINVSQQRDIYKYCSMNKYNVELVQEWKICFGGVTVCKLD